MWIRKSDILMFCENFSQCYNISKCEKSTWSVYNKCKSSKCLLLYNIFVLVLELCTLHAWSQILYYNLHFIQIRFTHVSDLIYVILDKWQCPPSILQVTYFICDSKMQLVSKQSLSILLNQLFYGYSQIEGPCVVWNLELDQWIFIKPQYMSMH